MARHLKTRRQINQFISRVIDEANDHAPQVARVITRLSNEILSRLNLPVDKVEVYQRNGKLARTCWVTIGGKRYAFSYNYNAGKIELRDRTTQGKVLYQFDNHTPRKDIIAQVSSL